MAVIKSADQFRYVGRGPLDNKALVKTYDELISLATWTTDDTLVAYNGMIVAVWLDSVESNNGIYFLHDKSVTKPLHKPNVTSSENWHKIGSIDNLPGLAEQVAALQTGLESAQKDLADIRNDVNDLQESATEIVDKLPEIGKPGKLYVVTEDATTYIWHNGKYLLVGDGADEDDIQVIMGGTP